MALTPLLFLASATGDGEDLLTGVEEPEGQSAKVSASEGVGDREREMVGVLHTDPYLCVKGPERDVFLRASTILGRV